MSDDDEVLCGNCGETVRTDASIGELAYHASGRCWLARELLKLRDR